MPQISQHSLDTSPAVSDRVAKTTCYMCACRCGINVHIRDEKIRYIEGNRDHPVNQGILCAKGSAGIMQHYSPARLTNPLRRVGERGKNQFVEITWEEALQEVVADLKKIRETDPKKLAFFTGRDQSQSLTGWWAQQFGTPNFASHGGFCSVNMAAAGIYTVGGSFWEFASPDWDKTQLFVMFGVAEDHDSNPLKIGIGKLKKRGVKIISVNPVQTGYSAVANDWLGITPGTDGLLILSVIQILLKSGKVDLNYLIRYTNAPWLVINQPNTKDHGLFARDEQGTPLVAIKQNNEISFVPYTAKFKPKDVILQPELELPDGRFVKPAFRLLADKYIDDDYSPEKVALKTGLSVTAIKKFASNLAEAAFAKEIVIDKPWTDWKGEQHDKIIGRPVSMHAMRGISAHSNGFQTCRALHLLQILLGSIDTPGGFRYKPVYPKSPRQHNKPFGKPQHVKPNQPLAGLPLGFPLSPDDLIVDESGAPQRIDKAYSWENPLSVHGLLHMVISNAYAQDPYAIDVLFLYMSNMAWNSAMNTKDTIAMLTAKNNQGEYVIPKIIYSDAYSSEMVAYADIVLPDTTYLERHDAISLLDRPICEPNAVGDAIRWPIFEPDRNVRCFQSVLIDIGARLNLPGFVDEQGNELYKDYADYIVNHQRKPGVGVLAGYRGSDGQLFGKGEPNPNQLSKYIEAGGFWHHEIPSEAQYYKFANKAYSQFAQKFDFNYCDEHIVLQIYSEELQSFRLAAEGFGKNQPPEHLRQRIIKHFDPLPIWYEPFEQQLVNNTELNFHAITQRPMAMYHSWGSQNAWLRQIHGYNPLYIPKKIALEYNLKNGDWVWLESHHQKIKVPVFITGGTNENTVWTWNAIGKRKGAWQLSSNATEANKGYLLNHLISELLPTTDTENSRLSNSDPITGQAAWFDLRVKISKAKIDEFGSIYPDFEQIDNGTQPPNNLRYGEQWTKHSN